MRGNNRLAGAPPHLLYAQLQYLVTAAWMTQGAVRWSPAPIPVDNMNTLYADPYAVVDLRSEYRIDKTFRVFGEITNLFNKTYASSTLIIDQARPDQAAFLPATVVASTPGSRRHSEGGIAWRLMSTAPASSSAAAPFSRPPVRRRSHRPVLSSQPSH